MDGRRPRESFVSVPKPKKRSKNGVVASRTDMLGRLAATGEESIEKVAIDRIRDEVSNWRNRGWMVHMNYNQASCLVRHSYFTGGNDSCNKLRTAPKADAYAEAWAQVDCAVSIPFDRLVTGNIAVKTISVYGL